MGLDAHVRCRCLQDGIAKPHPISARLAIDETSETFLTGSPSLDDWLIHDRWFAESCGHGGYLLSERLGNISSIADIRDFLLGLQSDPGPRFPILLEKVVYNGSHSGDCLPSNESSALLREVDTLLQSGDILADSEKEFFSALKRLCEASIASKNPIVF